VYSSRQLLLAAIRNGDRALGSKLPRARIDRARIDVVELGDLRCATVLSLADQRAQIGGQEADNTAAITDGAVAIVVTTVERAKELSMGSSPPVQHRPFPRSVAAPVSPPSDSPTRWMRRSRANGRETPDAASDAHRIASNTQDLDAVLTGSKRRGNAPEQYAAKPPKAVGGINQLTPLHTFDDTEG
jgi:hypothetical protein